jgi:cytochrome c oxidase assembly factor CtaG
MPGEQVLSGLIQAVPVYVVGTIFFMRVRTLARQGRPVETWRIAVFVTGLLVVIAAELPPIGTESDTRLSMHMVEHLLIGDVAALLIAISMTGPILRPLLTAPGLRHLRWLLHPLVTVPLWIVVYYAWHIPALYDAAVNNDLVHAFEHATMFGAGLALWIGLLGPLPKPSWFGNAAALIYVVVVRLAAAVIANVFIWSTTSFYPVYEDAGSRGGFSAAADQSLAGSIWMLEGSLVTIGVLAWLFLRWMSQGEAAQELVEYARGKGVELDPDRARRAVAAGQGDLLRRRVDEQAAAEARAPDPDRPPARYPLAT